MFKKRVEICQKIENSYLIYFNSNLNFILSYLRTSDKSLLIKILSDDMKRNLLQEKETIEIKAHQDKAIQSSQHQQNQTADALNQLIEIFRKTQEHGGCFASALSHKNNLFFLDRNQHDPRKILAELLGHDAPENIDTNTTDDTPSNQLITTLFLKKYQEHLSSQKELSFSEKMQLITIRSMITELERNSKHESVQIKEIKSGSSNLIEAHSDENIFTNIQTGSNQTFLPRLAYERNRHNTEKRLNAGSLDMNRVTKRSNTGANSTL